MQYITGPIVQIVQFTFEYVLIPLGRLPEIIRPDTIFLVIALIGLAYWLILQRKYTKYDDRHGRLR